MTTPSPSEVSINGESGARRDGMVLDAVEDDVVGEVVEVGGTLSSEVPMVQPARATNTTSVDHFQVIVCLYDNPAVPT